MINPLSKQAANVPLRWVYKYKWLTFLSKPTGNVALRWLYKAMCIKVAYFFSHGLYVTWRHKEMRGILMVAHIHVLSKRREVIE